MWRWRRTLKIKWTDKISNREIMFRVNAKLEILRTIGRRRNSAIGHIIRHSVWITNLIEGKILGKIQTGRPRRRFMD